MLYETVNPLENSSKPQHDRSYSEKERNHDDTFSEEELDN